MYPGSWELSLAAVLFIVRITCLEQAIKPLLEKFADDSVANQTENAVESLG